MRPHTTRHVSMYTGHKGGGCVDVAHIEFIGYTLIENGDLARLRHIAAELDAQPIPANIVDVLELALKALHKQKTLKAKEAVEAIRDLLRAAA